MKKIGNSGVTGILAALNEEAGIGSTGGFHVVFDVLWLGVLL